MTAGAAAERTKQLRNPYVGPRAFRVGEHLPNRQEEARDLADLVIAERAVLLHAPSGAGKTSLIQAAVIPMLEADDFRAIGLVRVDKQPANHQVHDRIRNRYVHSIAIYLLGTSQQHAPELERLTLEQVLDRVVPPDDSQRAAPPVLIVDQFEEVLKLDPTDWEAKEQFFHDLGAVLAKRRWWVLLAMREDFMGGLDRYLRLIPGQLRTTYRLDFLTPAEARAAAQVPAEHHGVVFEDQAVELLIERLARARVDRPDQETTWSSTPYVEPFELQVACRRLWQLARAARGDGFTTIGAADVARLDINRLRSRYYADAVAEVERRTGVAQRVIREWFETQLITPQGFRSQTVRGPVKDDPEVLRELQAANLVRSDSRSGTTWYELAHDRLIGAVLASNDEWRRSTYPPWQIAAHRWKHDNRPRTMLLSKVELRYAPSSRSRNLSPDEQEFLRESEEAAFKEGQLRRHRNVTGLVSVIALIEFALIIYLWLRL
jgi:hypothetical protein